MSKVKSYAQHELDILCKSAGPNPDDRPIIEEFIPEMLVLIDKFGDSGQSGGSAPYTANAICGALEKLMLHKPLCDITGLDEEWNHCTDMGDVSLWQNNRCSALFKTTDQCYYLDAIIWQGEDEYDTFSGTIEGIRSRQCVKSFPFEPKTFKVNCYRELYDVNNPKHLNNLGTVSCGDGDYVYFIKDEKQLEEVFNYYDKFQDNLKEN